MAKPSDPERAPVPRRGRALRVLLAAALAGAALGSGALLLARGLGQGSSLPVRQVLTPEAARPEHDAADVADVVGTRRWRCPMHPRVVRDGPGACPICGMRLVRTQQDEAHEVGGRGAPAR